MRWQPGILLVALVPMLGRAAEPAATFRAGVAACDVTPDAPTPMWGYGARHDMLSKGVRDRLLAKVVVIEAGGTKLAVVGMDLGRGPTAAMMATIREALAPRKFAGLLISGSHTHHGPVIELTDEPGRGKGKFDAAVAYSRDLPVRLARAIAEADDQLVPVTIRAASKDVALNRNRHSKREPKSVDPRLTLIRLDRADGSPLTVLVHFAAHPVMRPGELLEFSADYPGAMRAVVEPALKAPAVFLQGAGGDMSPNSPPEVHGADAFGEVLARAAIETAEAAKAAPAVKPSLAVATESHHFGMRLDIANPLNRVLYGRAFFPELIESTVPDYVGGTNPETTTALLGDQIGIVGLPGEPFHGHATRLRERADLPHALVFGYCNGHYLYFPTIEAASEGGYGADPRMSPIALGAGEAMLDRALIALYRMRGKFPGEP
ncbi:neutral/alkaline non-lysosomal ceramidase N-terminal domain-containing protein [Paludisphaera mucosa]|uniref:Neutral/alkaline non-lysosomal ceramidase N-terminal domain-containing protein n=1 Tax=Paludisphaera mucosa TaxID=3030827 RepID=A0ABT6FC40_9BACT|nr:neutral/alkaline non-lysosomal ceramidase N-terminal domain-containing protein [Paludisphaera mucosa]MDG3005154.1 neutral/alkaline non-lysosomal ceramidase N-terminal domain-containing protein [Paludisphaera mucosa]